MEKTLNHLHLIYGYIISILLICGIVLLWILTCRGVVSPVAFQNFSFAASVASIILAVVSIVFTIYSGAGVASSADTLIKTEKSIRKQIENLDGIEERIIKTIESGNIGISNKLDETKNSIDLLNSNAILSSVVPENISDSSKSKLLDISSNSGFGNMLLYICLKSIEKNKAWKFDILGNEWKLYFQGYLVAMATIKSLGFTYTADSDFSGIQKCSFDIDVATSTKDILECMKKRTDWDSTKMEFDKIDDYFDN